MARRDDLYPAAASIEGRGENSKPAIAITIPDLVDGVDVFDLANRAELEDFITYLRGLANEAWGPELDGAAVDRFEPAGWWRIVAPSGELRCETSDEAEARYYAKEEGLPLQRLYKEREVTEWREVAESDR